MSINKQEILNEFKKYVDNFDISNENIIRKYSHSIRVMNFAEQIVISENMSEEDVEIAIIIGLLHDYARFEQWTKYQTYSDIDSIDHGDLGVEILFNQNHIEKFYNKKENYNIIYDAIKYHNKYCIPENINDSSKVMCKIIRDADKLDIINLYVNGELSCEYSDEKISEDVRNQFFNHSLINRKNVKNINDLNLLKLALMYDYNYDFSYKYTLENNVLDKLYDKINNKEIFEEYYVYMKNFLENKINK